MSAMALAAPRRRGRARRLVERNAFIYRRTPMVIMTGILEPFLYLGSIGVGVGKLVGALGGVPYSHYVAPALLASAAMNGAIYDSTFNIYFKLHFAKTYDAILSTPLGTRDIAVGEIGWALIRGAIYATIFLLAMVAGGLTTSWWAVLALPVALLIGFTFAAIGMAATTYIRGFSDFDLVPLVTLPLFLFSATFYPLSTYSTPLQWVARLSPLYHGTLVERQLCLGHVGWEVLGHVAYLLAVGSAGLWVVARRLDALLLT
jgi:lipooligosaccharide transport system permease protein